MNTEVNQATVQGRVEHIVFAAQDSFFKILAIEVDDNNFDYDDTVLTVTGNFGDIQVDGEYEFFGRITTHAKYGRQFVADNYQRISTGTISGLVQYLSSERFKGIGEATAQKIVDELGINAVESILDDVTILDTLDVTDKVKKTLYQQLQQSDGMERAIYALNSFGFGATMASKIYEMYQLETLQILKSNPYQLVQDVDGVSFKRIDQMAQQQGIAFDDERRVRAAVIAALNAVTFDSGDTYIDVSQLKQATQRLLGSRVGLAEIEAAFENLLVNDYIVQEGEHVYIEAVYEAEKTIAQKMLRMTKYNRVSFDRQTVVKELAVVEGSNKFTYDEDQKEAIISALTNRLFILTGGPGTGKTTIVNAIVSTYKRLLRAEGMKEDAVLANILLAAPTGRAAKRLSEATNMPASTIHRLLGITGRENLDDIDIEPLEGRLLVIDEMSMVDTQLFALLVEAIAANMHVILVGDKDQLPSVGPGRVFYDLLASGLLSYRELEIIHRQGKGSTIIELANEVKQGRLPANLTERQPDRSFFPATGHQVRDIVQKIAETWQKRGFSVADMQILSPMYRSAAGVNELNELAQEIFNPLTPKKREIILKTGEIATSFRVGDKVMQTANDPENNVFNGDIGYIKTILYAKDKENDAKEDMVSVEFDTGLVDYPRQNLIQLRLAYATTIHKAQGAEYKLVIMPMVNSFSRMLQRNLLYTGLTRASESLVLIGETSAFVQAAKTEGIKRQTTLKERLLQSDLGEIVEITSDATATAEHVKETNGLNNTRNNQNDLPVADVLTIADTRVEPVVEAQSDMANTPQLTNDFAGPLTAEVIMAEIIDPNIGMMGMTPSDFSDEN